ncbi:MAG: helix-turn-helix transcriptional regulator [Candidatus Bathyarchaeota archaeon]|nr:MAG: helix-turn-helix transcriptional regulator [Candidatus Bathyarchaeota archaeon]
MESNTTPRIQEILESRRIVKLLSGRGTLEILFLFCCTNENIRFTRIHQIINHVSTKTLVTRLRELEKHNFIKRKTFNEIPPRVEYSLTDQGQKLAETLEPLIHWITQQRQEKTNTNILQ